MPAAKPFSSLARVYDAIMQDIDYDAWASFVLATVKRQGWEGRRVLDLGCGTGNSTVPFVMRGYEVTGLDASAEMLAVASAKLPAVAFVRADFTRFSLGASFDLVVSIFDSLNNLLCPEDFVEAARRAHAHLRPGGFFMFDVNTRVGLRELWEEGRAEGWAGDIYYLWQHSFDEASGLAQVEAYCRTPEGEFTETHLERPYDAGELRRLLAEAGFATVHILSYPSGEEASNTAERVWAVARRALVP